MNKTFKLKKYAPKRGVNRELGECDELKNTTPMLVTGSEKTRTGYQTAGSPYTALPHASFVEAYQRIASTEKPSAQECVFKWGFVGLEQRNYMYPYISAGSSTFNSSWVLLDEKTTTTTPYSVATNTIVVRGSDALGYGTTADYHKYWVVKNTSTTSYAYVTASTYDSANAGTTTLTLLESVASFTAAWTTSHSIIVQRWYHDNLAIDLAYQTYPSVTVREGEFRVSGGKASGATNKPSWVGYINRTFFPSQAKTFTYKGTFVSEREIKTPTDITVTQSMAAVSGTQVALETGYTYRVGVSVIYDGYQHSKIYETNVDYLETALSAHCLRVTPFIYGASTNKRITAVNVWVCREKGDTFLLSRVSPYYLVKELDLTSSTNTWTYTEGVFSIILDIDKTVWDNRGSEWSTLSGYTEGLATIHSYDQEINALGRQWIARVYNDTAAQDDLDRIYTNPTSGDGVVQPDIFPLEPDVFVGRAQWGDSSYITGIVENERGRIVVLKDRAVIDMGVEIDSDGTIQFRPLIISTQDGCASSNTGFVKTPYGIFFAGYNDFYVIDGLTIKALARDDWEDTYRALGTSDKQAAIIWYRDDEKAIFSQFNSGSNGFVYYLSTRDWRQFEYASVLTSYTTKRDGTIVWLAGSTAYKFDSSTTDAGTGISARWDTGKVRLFETDAEGYLNKVWVWKPTVASSGTLKCDLLLTINGSTNEIELNGLTKSDKRLLLSPLSTNAKAFDYMQIQYNTHASSKETGAVEFSDIEIDFEMRKKVRAA